MTTPFDASTPQPGAIESPSVSLADLKVQVASGDVLLATMDSKTDEWFWSGGYISQETEASGRTSFKFQDFKWTDQDRWPDRRALVRVSNLALVRIAKLDSPSCQHVNEPYKAGWPEYADG